METMVILGSYFCGSMFFLLQIWGCIFVAPLQLQQWICCCLLVRGMPRHSIYEESYITYIHESLSSCLCLGMIVYTKCSPISCVCVMCSIPCFLCPSSPQISLSSKSWSKANVAPCCTWDVMWSQVSWPVFSSGHVVLWLAIVLNRILSPVRDTSVGVCMRTLHLETDFSYSHWQAWGYFYVQHVFSWYQHLPLLGCQ